MVGLLSGSIFMDFPLCLPIREPVLTGFFNFNIELSICRTFVASVSTSHNPETISNLKYHYLKHF